MNTEIILPVPELKSALPGLNKLVGRKFTLPILSSVKISRRKNGEVSLQATDLNAHATYTLNNSQPGEAVEVLVPLEQLNKAFKCTTKSKQDVAVVFEGNATKLRYSIGGSAVEQPLNPMPLNEWPPVPRITTEATLLTPGFGQALKQALACCIEEHSRVELRGACLDARDAKSHYIVSGDGHMMFAANSFTFPIKETVTIPDSKFLASGELLDTEPCFLAVQPGKKPSDTKHVCLQTKQWQFVTREVDGVFPNWKHNLPVIDGKWTIVQLSAAAVQNLLKVIPNLPGADDRNSPIRLRMDKVLWVEGKNQEDADSTKIAIQEVTIAGKSREITLNRQYLLQALSFGLDELAVLEELRPIVCRKDGKQMVIMPLDLKGPRKANPTSPAPQPPPSTPASVPDKPQEERKEMARTSTTPESTETAATPDSPFKLAMKQVDAVRESLKQVMRDLANVLDTLKVAEKDKKATDREIEEFREKLREIQGIKI